MTFFSVVTQSPIPKNFRIQQKKNADKTPISLLQRYCWDKWGGRAGPTPPHPTPPKSRSKKVCQRCAPEMAKKHVVPPLLHVCSELPFSCIPQCLPVFNTPILRVAHKEWFFLFQKILIILPFEIVRNIPETKPTLKECSFLKKYDCSKKSVLWT